MTPRLCIPVSKTLRFLSDYVIFALMSDFDFNNATRPQNEEDFQPGATITPEGVSLFAADFRAQALKAGLLVDVSDTAAEVGFVVPVAVTKNVWDDVHAIPAAYSHEDARGRLWDVLSMASHAVRQSSPDSTETRYNLILHVGRSSRYPVRAVCHPGDDLEPVITLSNPEKDLFVEMGQIVLTDGALDAFVSAGASPALFLARHQRGDWGDVDAEDAAANNRSARDGTRLLSAYTLPSTQIGIWIITEWDRSVTTILLPSEY